jgi:hypothetical protein
MSRPKTKIDVAELEKLYGLQCTDEEVASFLGVSIRTIERRRKVKRFAELMDRAKAKGRVSVRRNLFRLANAGNIAASIFLAKNLLGYKDVTSNEHTGPDGGPLLISVADALQQRRNKLAEHRKLVGAAVEVSIIPTKPSE